MAKRRSAGKVQPAPLTLHFSLSSEANEQYIDLSQCASIINRRFYRQGLNWAVAGFKVITSPGETGQITVSKIPSTWMVSNSWEKCFRSWKRQQDEALDDGENESVRAAFNDFKIFADAEHHALGVAGNLIPVMHSLILGEWEASQLVIPNYGVPGVNYEPFLHMVGGDVGGAGGSLGMVKAYANSRGVPQSPDPAVPAGVLSNENFLNMMFDVGDNNEDVMDNVVDKNNDLPYDQLRYPGADQQASDLEIHDFCPVTSTTVGGSSSIPGGTFPCGLIKFQCTGITPSFEPTLLVYLVPGPSRGYLTQPMTEM